MGVYGGSTNSWLNLSSSNSLNGLVKNGLVLALDAGRTLSYPGSGNTWTDLSGNTINGTLSTSSYSNSDGGSIVFNSLNSSYVTLGTPSLLNGVQVPLTICVWAKLTNSIGNKTLYSAYKSTSSSQLYSLIRLDNGVLKYYASTSPGGYQSAGSFSPTLNVWNFYTVTVSGTISSPTVTIYLNNSSQSFSYSAFSSTPDLTVNFRVGGNQFFPSSEGWDGNISQVSVYNRALTESEISQNFNVTRKRYGV